jgi:DNA-binding transcriptional regulator YhcF (GntR family)
VLAVHERHDDRRGRLTPQPDRQQGHRALRILRDEGLLEFRRGRGISVAGTPERGAVIARAKELIEFARLHGYRRDDLVKIIEEIG